MTMARISALRIARLPVPLASLVGAASALFMVSVWAPLQVRSLDDALTPTQTQTASSHVDWLNVPYTTSDGAISSLAGSNGHVRIVTMIYAHCPGMCPLTIATLKGIEAALPADQRSKLEVIAITLDPVQDSIAALKEFGRSRQVDSKRWTFGRTATDSVAQIASRLGINFRVLGDQTVDHQSAFALLDKDGKVLARTSRTQDADPRFLAAVRAALQN